MEYTPGRPAAAAADAAAAEARRRGRPGRGRLHSLADDSACPATARAVAVCARRSPATGRRWPRCGRRVRETPRRAAAALATEAADHARAAEHAAELAERSRTAPGRRVAAARERHETLAADGRRRRRRTAAPARPRSTAALRACEEAERAGPPRTGRAPRPREAAADAVRTRVAYRDRGDRTDPCRGHRRLRRFAGTGLLAVALPGTGASPTGLRGRPNPRSRFARAMERELEAEDDSDPAWDRVQRRITEELKDLADALPPRPPRRLGTMREDGMVVDIVFQGRDPTVADLAAALAAEIADRQRLLSAREREILENHLVNEVAGTLQELVAAAEHQVAAMNGELADRPTCTGMRLRLVWRPARDAPAGLAAAARGCCGRPPTSGRTRTAGARRLPAGADRAARARDAAAPGGTAHQARSTTAPGTSSRSSATRTASGSSGDRSGASGGERVLAACVPLFAAASSHYASAGNPHAPAWSRSTRRSPASTTTPAPSAWACWPPSTSTW